MTEDLHGAAVKSRRLRRCAVGLIVAGALSIWLAPKCLQAVGEVLVADEAASAPDAVVTFSGDKRYEYVAQLAKGKRECRVVVLKHARSRLETAGIIRCENEVEIEQIIKAGVPREAIVTLESEAYRDDWDDVRVLGDWVSREDAGCVVVLTSRFCSSTVRYVLDRQVSPTVAGRVHIKSLKDRRFDETNWWRSRMGIKECLSAYLSFVYHRIAGPPASRYEDRWDPDEYERSLQQKMSRQG